MSDSEQKKPAGGSGAWTEEEKLGLLFSIIESSVAKVEWANTRLPAGRTLKACSVWLDKQRNARKKARADAGEEEGSLPKTPKTPAKSKKRAAKAEGESEGGEEEDIPKAKKPKTPRTKKETPTNVKAGAELAEDWKSEEPATEQTVKAEVEAEAEMMT